GPTRGGDDRGDAGEILRPVLGEDELARQAKGQVEDAEPWAGPRKGGIEAGEIGDALYPLEPQPALMRPAGCDDDRLARRWRGGEVDAMEQRGLQEGARGRAGVGARGGARVRE